jgi:hypothetical protein
MVNEVFLMVQSATQAVAPAALQHGCLLQKKLHGTDMPTGKFRIEALWR